jgi:hypothetical protein
MSFVGNIFSKLGLGDAGMTSFFPQYASPPSHPVDEHYLAELSPRADDALLANDSSDHSPNGGSSNVVRNGGHSVHVHGKGDHDQVKASVTFQNPPHSRLGDATRDHRVEKRGYQRREENIEGPEIWRPTFLSEPRDPYAGDGTLQTSFFESVFTTRPAYSDRAHSTKIDHSFRLIERRERQMQKELQQLLDAQDYALEKHLASTIPEDGVAQSSGRPGHVVPVRQPKKRHLSKKEARLGISRCMTQLSDLKNEEEAYIATALAERKAALSRLRNLSTKRNSIVAEMKAIESDHDQPLKNEIKRMEDHHHAVCEDILKLEEKLRGLRRTKTKLENKISEAKSARDSELSGYKGALNECDKRIRDILTYPEVSVLEVEGPMTQDADLKALLGRHISGLEFLSMRSERRTLPMAKDWWEGEVQVLELRKTAVDKERAALDEGTQLWQGMVDHLEEHDQHLSLTFDAMSRYATSKQQDSDFNELGEILKKQYTMCKETTKELEQLYDYTEAQGWKLLVTALSAEINYFHGLKKQLGDTLDFAGWGDGVATPRRPSTPSSTRDGDDLPSADHNDIRAGRREILEVEEELTGSVIRRWEGTDEPCRDVSNDNNNDLLTHTRHRATEDSDNEVPPGLLISEVRNESDDEHNEVPLEFLSMHSPTLKFRNRLKEKTGDLGAKNEERRRRSIGPL